MAKSYNCPACGAPNTPMEGFEGNDIKCWKCQVTFLATFLADKRTIVPGSITHTYRDPLLEERQKTHGDFATNADASQSLKRIFRDHKYETMKPVHTEALDMIALKISRILSGQASYKDHWDDIAGYAKLGSEACQIK